MSQPKTKLNFLNSIIEEEAGKPNTKSAFEILLEEWGTMSSTGKRRRPTVGVLLEYLIEIKAIRAASFLSEKVLGGTSPHLTGPFEMVETPVPSL